MASRYWVGGTGTWDASTTTHWSASSGGSGGASVPTSSDNVFLDGNSGGGTVTVSGSGLVCSALNFTGFAGTFAGSVLISVYGSLTAGSSMTWSASSIINLLSTTTSETITTNGVNIASSLRIFAGATTTYALQDNLLTTGLLQIGTGILDANNFNLTVPSFLSNVSTARTVLMGSGVWTITGTGTSWNMISTNLTLTASTSTIKFTNTSNTAITFAGADKSYNNIWFSRGASTASNTISGSNTFNDFKDDGSVAHSILFTVGTTQIVTTFTVSGTAGNLITINSTTTGTHTLSKASGTVSRDYLSVQHSIATGGASWYAGMNSTDNQAVATAGSGWLFTALPPTVTTQAVSSILPTSATGNGNITATGGENADVRGIVYSTSTQSLPGNVAPGSSGYSSVVSDAGSFSTGAFTESLTGLTVSTTYYARAYAHNSGGYSYGGEVSFTTGSVPTVTTQAVSSIATTTATGNGNVTSDGGGTVSERGVVWNTSTAPTTANSKAAAAAGGTGAFTASMTQLVGKTLYYVRAYAINEGGTSYGSEVTFTTAGFTNPTNAYASDNTYATVVADTGVIAVSLSWDGGVTYTSELTKTFTGAEGSQTFGLGSTELWGRTWIGDEVDDTSYRVKVRCGSLTWGHVYKTFGHAPGASVIMTGIAIAIEAKWDGATTSIDHITSTIDYGTSTVAVAAGSQAYASNGRKAGEGAGVGTGVIVFFDGSNWIAVDTGATAAA